jgi:thiamine biosynthesis protein ThiI
MNDVAPARGAILCRYGELFLKSGNRTRFERVLHDNIRFALRDVPETKVTSIHGRLIVRAPTDAVEEACERLVRVFGLVSISPISVVPAGRAADLDTLADAAITAARDAVAREPALGHSFKVDSRRVNKSFPHTSHAISCHLGARVNVALGIPVDVHRPALTLGVEIAMSGEAFVFAGRRPGPGGLPVGTAGRALLLLSGGIDSPVAGYLAAKRGLAVDAVYFHSPPFVGEKTRDKVLSLARTLTRYGACGRVFVAPFTEVQKRLRENGKASLAVLLYRRMMMRIADRIADRAGAGALVTGETLSQVASQTMANMAVIQAAARRLVLRPLVTFDKVETIEIARRIGTFDLSTLPHDDCCSLFVPAHPATNARLDDALRSERGLDVDAEADAAAAQAEEVSL